jgi:hypothetical protein
MGIHFKQPNGRVDELVEELVRLQGRISIIWRI